MASRIAVTMPGKSGDSLWSMPTVREIARQYGPVDFYIMPLYGGLCELYNLQPYIASAQILPEWGLIGDVPGAQPSVNPPLPFEYERVFQLGYHSWPDRFLMDFIAFQAGITLQEYFPFIEVGEPQGIDNTVAIGFSGIYLQYPEYIDKFINPYKALLDDLSIPWVDVSNGSWVDVAKAIKRSKVYIGDNSALHVLAHGLNVPVLLAESNKDRRSPTFLSPYGSEFVLDCVSIIDHLEVFVEKTVERIMEE